MTKSARQCAADVIVDHYLSSQELVGQPVKCMCTASHGGSSWRQVQGNLGERQYEAVIFLRVKFAWRGMGVFYWSIHGDCRCQGGNGGGETRRMSDEGVI